MIRRLAIILLFACTVAASAAQGTFAVYRYLASQSETENWNGRDGKAGERGPLQFMEITWRQHMPGVPFSEARKIGPSWECGRKHVAWLRAQLHAAGCDDGPFMVALCWNAGLDQTLSGKAPVKSYQRAGRVENLYRTRGGGHP